MTDTQIVISSKPIGYFVETENNEVLEEIVSKMSINQRLVAVQKVIEEITFNELSSSTEVKGFCQEVNRLNLNKHDAIQLARWILQKHL
ncbi:hypothetical protein [Okeania sp. SIO2B9]|uniref:hypothetical protein n=1 Tax=Okeania sp. SIO2B9 TaxID=2607782 RepID=UPI00142A383B|nr:hypothetical protein [Okeania sp. SIO2B9]NES88598.1 hypothetical protein [Okeania sp. SIO2B9]